MCSSWLEQLHGKAISHQLPAKPQLSSHIFLSLSLSLITGLSPSLCILFLGDRVSGRRLGQGNDFIFLFVKLRINRSSTSSWAEVKRHWVQLVAALRVTCTVWVHSIHLELKRLWKKLIYVWVKTNFLLVNISIIGNLWYWKKIQITWRF